MRRGVFEEFAEGKRVTTQFPRIPYAEAMLKYGVDKPDLRNPLVIADVTEEFARDEVEFKAFKGVIKAGGVVRAIPATGAGGQPRSFLRQAQRLGPERGCARPRLHRVRDEGGVLAGKGPIAKFIPAEVQATIAAKTGTKAGDAVFFSAGTEAKAAALAGKARIRIGDELGLCDKDQFAFCWITDFPMFEWNEDEKRVDFSHNPFSMPNFEHDAFLALDAPMPRRS